MKKKLILCFLISIGCYQINQAQTIKKQTISPEEGTVCAVSSTEYTISVSEVFQTCTINWTATNGNAYKDVNDQRKVTVEWTDTPGAKGTLTATFTACDEKDKENNNKQVSLTELILSVKDQSWGVYTSSYNADFCNTSSVNIVMPNMYVKGTGGWDEPPKTEVGYVWNLPDGWVEKNTGLNDLETLTNYITIVPTECAVDGDISVKGTLKGLGLCENGEESSTAVININSTIPDVTLGPEAGYISPSACNTSPVEFHASPEPLLGCNDYFKWTFPEGWKWLDPSTGEFKSSPVNTTSNVIELTPSGTSADVGQFNVELFFACGNSVDGVYNITSFEEPKIDGPDFVCDGSATFNLINVHDQAPVSWLVMPSNLLTSSGTGTGPTANITTVTGLGGNALIRFTCNNNNLELEKGFDIGIPPAPQIMPAGPFTVEPNTTLNLGTPDIAPTIEWSFIGNSSDYTYAIRNNGYADIYCDFTPTAPGDFQVKARANYGCGFGAYSSVDITCQINKPDLIIENVSSMLTETQATITYNLKNQGNTTAFAPTVSFYYSSNSTYEAGSDPLIGTSTFSDLTAGSSSSASRRILLNSYNYILIYADASNSISEISEINNLQSVYVRYFGSSSIISKKPSFTASPIPFNNTLNLEFENENEKGNGKFEKNIFLFNINTGIVELSEIIRNNKAVIQTNKLPKGEYILVVEDEEIREAIKVYKE